MINKILATIILITTPTFSMDIADIIEITPLTQRQNLLRLTYERIEKNYFYDSMGLKSDLFFGINFHNNKKFPGLTPSTYLSKIREIKTTKVSYADFGIEYNWEGYLLRNSNTNPHVYFFNYLPNQDLENDSKVMTCQSWKGPLIEGKSLELHKIISRIVLKRAHENEVYPSNTTKYITNLFVVTKDIDTYLNNLIKEACEKMKNKNTQIQTTKNKNTQIQTPKNRNTQIPIIEKEFPSTKSEKSEAERTNLLVEIYKDIGKREIVRSSLSLFRKAYFSDKGFKKYTKEKLYKAFCRTKNTTISVPNSKINFKCQGQILDKSKSTDPDVYFFMNLLTDELKKNNPMRIDSAYPDTTIEGKNLEFYKLISGLIIKDFYKNGGEKIKRHRVLFIVTQDIDIYLKNLIKKGIEEMSPSPTNTLLPSSNESPSREKRKHDQISNNTTLNLEKNKNEILDLNFSNKISETMSLNAISNLFYTNKTIELTSPNEILDLNFSNDFSQTMSLNEMLDVLSQNKTIEPTFSNEILDLTSPNEIIDLTYTNEISDLMSLNEMLNLICPNKTIEPTFSNEILKPTFSNENSSQGKRDRNSEEDDIL